jgi:hypothetical protein
LGVVEVLADQDELVFGLGTVFPLVVIEGEPLAAEVEDVAFGAFVEPEDAFGSEDVGAELVVEEVLEFADAEGPIATKGERGKAFDFQVVGITAVGVVVAGMVVSGMIVARMIVARMIVSGVVVMFAMTVIMVAVRMVGGGVAVVIMFVVVARMIVSGVVIMLTMAVVMVAVRVILARFVKLPLLAVGIEILIGFK